MTSAPPVDAIHPFISRWANSEAAERANYQLFLAELCDLLEVQRPDPAGAVASDNAYVFERSVTFNNGDGKTSTGRIDLYKRDCFVVEAKQGSEKASGESLNGKKKKSKGTATRGTDKWDEAMVAAHGQAVQYIRALPADEGNPPFIIVVDIGHSFEIYSDFSRAGKTYIPFPDPLNYRISIKDLDKLEIIERLRKIWEDPMSLDPSRVSAEVTREVAARLAKLARSLESSGHAPEAVATFLMRCLFTMFAEDIELLEKGAFTDMLADMVKHRQPQVFSQSAESFWALMNTGGFDRVTRSTFLKFNGGLFADTSALPLTQEQLELLHDAAKSNWRNVEPAIFGTLLERALDPIERHKLGAHYTPRAYVERLVMPTLVEPLRAEWDAVRGVVLTYLRDNKADKAREELSAFHRQLCSTRVLDPACGSGNFLYVALEHMKRLEGEVLEMIEKLGSQGRSIDFGELTVDPHQFLGIEINPRAAAIAEMVLWIGYLQWHFRTHGDALPREPVLQAYHNIECRDAVLAYDAVEPLLDADGTPITRWDGRTTKKHPVTGEDVPDETARVPVLKYINPRKAEWPEAEYIVGNPPFLGPAMMRQALGDGYTEAIRKAYKELPDSIDFVMYWWHKAGDLLEATKVQRFGFITTNSLRQTFNRRVLTMHMESKSAISLSFAIPDHPWVDSVDGAAVRIAMTTCAGQQGAGRLYRVVAERGTSGDNPEISFVESIGQINPNLSIGADVNQARQLLANSLVSSPGVKLHGAGFIVNRDEAQKIGLGRVPGLEDHVREYRNGKDLTQSPRDVMVIDLYGLSLEQVIARYPAVYQWLHNRVKPERDQNSRLSYRNNWWIFGEPRGSFRPALEGLNRYIATVETSKHRFFVFLDTSILPDNRLVNFALDDALYLGMLSSRIHVVWALATGGRMGVGNDPIYNKTLCFETFPLPDPTNTQRDQIRQLGESLDAHRKRQQTAHPTLTVTDMYNVLEKLRSGEPLTAKEKLTHEHGLVSVLKQIHDDLDRTVLDAYGWSDLFPLLDDRPRREELEETILERLVALNAERAEEERRGIIRWLRPEYQNPQGSTVQEMELEESEAAAAPAPKATAKQLWPSHMRDQLQTVRAAITGQQSAITAEQIARGFTGARTAKVTEILESLESLGQAREVEEGRWVG